MNLSLPVNSTSMYRRQTIFKDDNDNPSIGLLVCKSKNETVVKWAFEGIDRPLGVATYELDEVLKRHWQRNCQVLKT